MEWTHSRFTSALIPACFAGFEAASQSTKRAELGGDSESFAMKRRRRAQPGKPADEGPKPERSRSSAVWPVFANKWRSVVNQKTGENFEVENICLPKCGEVRVVSPEMKGAAALRE